MRRTIAVSDAHIHDNSRQQQITALCEYLRTEHPPLLVLVGDMADPWEADWADIKLTASWGKLSELCDARARADLETIYINRNHDYNAKPEHLPSAMMVGEYREDNFLFIHGWEWDLIWSGLFGIPGIGRAAFWISRKMPWLMILINHKLLSWRKAKTPGALKRKSHVADWDLQKEIVHLRARQYAHTKRIFVVMGHTHWPTCDSLIADCGDWESSFSLVDISADGKITLKHLVNNMIIDM